MRVEPQAVAGDPARPVGVAENLCRVEPPVVVGDPLHRVGPDRVVEGARQVKQMYSLVIDARDVHNTYQMDR